MNAKFSKLLEPITIGTMELKNRIVMCPMCSGYANVNGDVSERIIDYYAARAKGGAGLIIIEGTAVDRFLGNARQLPRLFIDNDILIAGLRSLVERIHLNGAKVAIQFQHHGRWATPLKPGTQSLAPSAAPGRVAAGAREMTIKEIQDVQDEFAEAARRAKQAGFDAIAINGGGGTLPQQFLTPLDNKRTDEYGGDLDGRMKFVIELIEKMQQQVGADYPIIYDHPALEFVEGGITLEEGKIIAQRLEDLGVAAFRIHPHAREDIRLFALHIPPAAIPHGSQVHLAEEYKKVLKRAKVIVGRRINDPILANRILEEDKADIIALGRPLIADPEFPNKVAEGRIEDIRKCIACNHCWWCYTHLLPVSCTVNPASGKERDFEIKPAQRTKKVMVVGGGPGGMEAARVARLRQHEVTLYEKEDKLGGQLNIANVPPYKEEINGLLQYYKKQLDKVGVKVVLGKEVTNKLIQQEKPEVVVLATGANPKIPSIPGVENNIVTTYLDVLTEKVTVGQKVIIVGGGTVGCEIAEYVACEGKKVIVVEQLSQVCIELDELTRGLLLDRLEKKQVKILTSTKVEEITDKGVIIKNNNENRDFIEADTVIIAVGVTPNRPLNKLREMGMEVYSVGDCISPRTILEAVQEGWWVASKI